MLELRKLYGLSKTKQRKRLMGCIVYSPHWLQTTLSHIAKMGELYTYIIRGAFGVVSALYIERLYFLFVTYLIISRYRKTQT